MKKRIISKEELTNAIKISLTLGDVISNLQIPENGKSRDKIKFLSNEYGIDISNLNPNEIVYYVILSKVTKVSYNEKKNTVKKYLDCVTQYVYKKTLQQPRIVDIINKIGIR